MLENVQFDGALKQIDFEGGGQARQPLRVPLHAASGPADPSDGAETPPFFEHKAFIPLPSRGSPDQCVTRQARCWARRLGPRSCSMPSSAHWCEEMPVQASADLLDVGGLDRIWRVVTHYVEEAPPKVQGDRTAGPR